MDMPKNSVTHKKEPTAKKLPKFEFLSEFRQFAFQDNLVSLATGVVIGTAFKNVSTSLVEDIIMPPLGLVLGRVDFSNLYFSLNGVSYSSLTEAEAAGAPLIRYGEFLSVLIDFLLTAISVYVVLFFLLRQRPSRKK
jgi:large conductance mechanosensitive channel